MYAESEKKTSRPIFHRWWIIWKEAKKPSGHWFIQNAQSSLWYKRTQTHSGLYSIAQQPTHPLVRHQHGNICRIYAFIWKLFVCLYNIILLCLRVCGRFSPFLWEKSWINKENEEICLQMKSGWNDTKYVCVPVKLLSPPPPSSFIKWKSNQMQFRPTTARREKVPTENFSKNRVFLLSK